MKNFEKFMLVALIVAGLSASPSQAEEDTPSQTLSTAQKADLSGRIEALEKTVERLDAEVEILKTQGTMVIQASRISFLNSTYLKGGLSLVLPRPSSFSFETDTGLGTQLAVGQYIGRNHLVELGLDWDVHLAASFRYSYELHTSRSGITFGPVIGYRTRIADLDPFDNYVNTPQAVQPGFLMLGVLGGMPVSSEAMITTEFTYLTADQKIINIYVSFRFFL